MKRPDLEPRETREVCVAHGWVGVRAFRRDRHDLCEAPEDSIEDVSEDEDSDGADEEEMEIEAESDRPLWGRASARRRGIPPKKTVAARRITQVELRAGQAELQVLGADEPYDRPKTRGACQWCPVCQLVRDGKSFGNDREALRALKQEEGASRHPKSNGAPQPLDRSVILRTLGLDRFACGHLAAEVLYRSRPCVFVSCKHALYLDVSDTGSLIFNFPHLDPGQMRADQSCSLDLADRGGMTLEEIAVVTNLTRERIRQVELRTLIRRARPAAVALGLAAGDAAEIGARRRVGPGADLVETGVDGESPSDVNGNGS